MDVWVLLPAVLVLILGSTTADPIFSCENLSFDTCSCSGYSPTLFELTCPQLNVEVQISLRDSVQFQCFSNDSMGFSTLSGLHVGDVERFILRLCPMPNIAMRELMAKIGINKIKMLQIQSYSTLNDTLKKKHFEKLFDVTTLSLNNNGLTSLPSDIFEDMGNLTRLDMKYNYIDLPKEIFYFTPKLKELELGMNNMTHLKPGIFKNLDHLRLLNLWSNKLTNLTRSVFSDVPNLESLDLNTNQMENIRPDLFSDLTKLKQLNLYGNNFASLPNGLLSGNYDLEEFQMHENHRSVTLPPAFLSNLTKLKMVRLSGSKIMSLPEDIFSGSKNILTIYLNGNSLSTLSKDTFAYLESLEYLDLSVNKIDYLPGKLFYYTSNLTVLKLDYNNIMEIPLELFLRLDKLEYLDLRFNNIKSITGEQFFSLASLKTLNISDNQLTSLGLEYQLNDLGSYSVLLKNSQLEDLQLANNSLSEIYLDWKLVMKKLRVLKLSFNQFTYLRTDDFEFYGDIVVDLSNNNISWVNFWDAKLVAARIFDVFNSSYARDQQIRSKIIKLDNNPFHCDCQLLPFIQFLHGELSPEVQYLYNIPSVNLKCKESTNLEKMLLSYVPYSLLTCEFKNNTESYICPENCVCQYRAIDKGNIINCQNAGLRQVPSVLPTYRNANHTELYLERNQLRDIKIPENKGYDNVTHFNFADNNISTINTSGFSKKLKVCKFL